jgi:hypothetical protein
MKRAFAIAACVCALIGGVYFAASKWAIRHETLDLFDARAGAAGRGRLPCAGITR